MDRMRNMLCGKRREGAEAGQQAAPGSGSGSATARSRRLLRDALLIACVLAAGALLWLAVGAALGGGMPADGEPTGSGRYAVISCEGEPDERIPLDAEGSYPIETSRGRNVVRIALGEASIEEADCPGQDCIQQGRISEPGEALVCLPHRLVVKIEG